MKKKYNPFKMWGSYVGALTLVIWNFGVLGFRFNLYREYFLGLVFYPIIFGFLIGWGIHSLIRVVRK